MGYVGATQLRKMGFSPRSGIYPFEKVVAENAGGVTPVAARLSTSALILFLLGASGLKHLVVPGFLNSLVD